MPTLTNQSHKPDSTLPRMLLISYYFPPFKGVGAMRSAYWARNMYRYGIAVDVISAFEPEEEQGYRHFHVSPGKGGPLSLLIRDEGLKWKKPVMEFLNRHDLPGYDYVVISGGPFMQMSLARKIRNIYPHIRIILDFRDPFADNPRFGQSAFRRSIKRYFESNFTREADLVITVNQYCGALITTDTSKLRIIQNGYDESLSQGVLPMEFSPQAAFHLVHTGSFYTDRDPTVLIDALEKRKDTGMLLHHFGQSNDVVKRASQSSCFMDHGLLPLKEAYAAVAGADACVLITSGEAFESTTKIFDYIAFQKKILIITTGEPETGSLYEITRDYPNVVWSRNTVTAITEAIQALKKMEGQPLDPTPWSRAAGLQKLMGILQR